jgi:hypothetical protein
MKKPKFKYIAQKHKSGCAIACIAMITGESYDNVASKFHSDLDEKGVDTAHTIDYLINKNLSPVTIMLDRATIETKNQFCKNLYKPFADIHIFRVIPWADQSDIIHAIIVDNKGKVYDPHNEAFKSLDKYYEILQIIGFWYEK